MNALLQEAVRGLRGRRVPTLVTIGGFAIALTACLLVAMLAWALSRPDPAIPDPERTVVLGTQRNLPDRLGPWRNRAPLAFATLLRERGVPLERLGRAVQDGLDIRIDGRLQPILLYYSDPGVPSLLGLTALSGDVEATLGRRDGIVITMDAVRRLWGDVSPAEAVGRQVEARGSVNPETFAFYEIGAVLPDIDLRNPLGFRSEFIGRAIGLVGFDSQVKLPRFEDASFNNDGWVFAQLPAGGSSASIGGWMREAAQGSSLYAKLPPEMTAGREPAFYRGLTLNQAVVAGLGPLQSARWQTVRALGAASLLLLILAVLNGMNLQTASLLQRRRETALRLSVGADPGRLLSLWAMEVFLILGLATGLALLLAWWLAPAVGQWMDLAPDYAFGDPIPVQVVAGLVLTVLVLWPVTLAVPAWRALKSAPAPALQGRTASDGPWGRRIRQGLLSLQMLGAMVLLSLTGIVAIQQYHLLTAERGFDLENRLALIVLTNPEDVPSMAPFLSALERHSEVRSWAFGYLPVGNGATEPHTTASQRTTTLRLTTVSVGYFDTFGMRILAGTPRLGTGETSLVIDAQAARLLGFSSPEAAVGELVRGGEQGNDPRRIVAVVNDVKAERAGVPPMPHAFLLSDRTQWDVSIRVADASVRSDIVDLFEEYGPRLVFAVKPAEEEFAGQFTQERRLVELLGVCALLTLSVAMLGAYTLVADTLRRRRTELILHRLHGASDLAIVKHLGRELALPLLAAVVLAVPIAILLGSMHLSDFVGRPSEFLGIVLPIAAGALAVAAVTAVSAMRFFRQALALQPMEALR